MKNLYKVLRIKHYIKNVLIFLPFIFGGVLSVLSIKNMILAFLAFSAMASTIYIINDIRDREKDKNHPTKKHRPIASGKISVKFAIILAILMFAISIGINYLCATTVYSYVWLIIYFVLNVLYSLKLKHIPICDIALLVSFYIIRIYYGAAVGVVQVSKWLYLTVMSLAAFLAFGKRRNELEKSGDEARDVLKYYNHEFLDKFMYLSLGISITFYSLWAVEQTHEYFSFTIPIVFVMLMRYCMIIEDDSDGDPVEVVTKDKSLLLLGILYLICCAYLVFQLGV